MTHLQRLLTMIRKQTKLSGVVEYQHEPFIDHRGTYVEIYNEAMYGVSSEIKFIQDDVSISYKNVLRGLHGDHATWKLVSCLYGEIYFIVLDTREDSLSFGKWESFLLNDKNFRQILVPPGCVNGHLVLSEKAIFHYKQTTYYSKNQFTVRWNDPKYGIWWPNLNPILSMRDEFGHYVD